MRFADWLTTTETSEHHFAARCGVARETVRRWRTGARDPDLETMARIFDLTGGQVTPNDWAGVGPREEVSQVAT